MLVRIKVIGLMGAEQRYGKPMRKLETVKTAAP
jgi:hypothetical protein